MEALLCRRNGDPTVPPNSSEASALAFSTAQPIPELNSPTAVRVRIRATSLNFANYLQILGKYQEKPPFPFIPGSDYSGVVESVGPGVSKFKIGDPVCSFTSTGSFAQFIVADENALFRVPDGCDLVAAAALPVAYGTSHVALVQRAQLSSGQVLLVLGAAGGVGVSAVQIGKICGAIVIAVARGEEKVRLLKSLGVDHVVDLSKGNVIESVKGFLKTRKLKGVDVLYDPVGGKLTKESLKLLNWGAQILVIGFASGEIPVIPANIALVKNWTIHGLYWGSYQIHRPGALGDSMEKLMFWLTSGVIKIHISHTYSLPEANLAFAAMKDRKVIGKVMIAFGDEKKVVSGPIRTEPVYRPMTTMKIIHVPCLEDNYSYIIIDEATKEGAAVDPVEPEKVVRVAGENGVELKLVLTTHHHWDHAGGNEKIKDLVPGIRVYGGSVDNVKGCTDKLENGDKLSLGRDIHILALHTPCHTKGHISYFVTGKDEEDPAVFTGDTLFIAGCGKFFEGTAEQMYQSLCVTLGSLPKPTRVYCGHEYTVKNLQFALTVEPDNARTVQKFSWAQQKRQAQLPTVPSTIEEELETNPFMRVDLPEIQDKVGSKSPVEALKEIRQRKDNWRG